MIILLMAVSYLLLVYLLLALAQRGKRHGTVTNPRSIHSGDC